MSGREQRGSEGFCPYLCKKTFMETNGSMGISIIPEVAAQIRAKKYADLMMDWTFKFVFGPSGKYKEGLVSLLNAIIPDKKIMSIDYLPTEMLGEVAEQRRSIMDLRCVAEDGTQFVVEVQNYREDGFFERCIAYACKLFLEQNRRGTEYKDLMPVYVVALLSEKASKAIDMYKECPDQVIYDHTMVEKLSGIFAPRTISVIFADTGKFKKDITECVDDVDRWLFLLRHSTRIMEYSEEFQSEVFRRVLESLEISSFTQEEFNMYYTEEEQKKIRQAQDATQRRIGREEGLAEGRAEGRAEGETIKASQIAKNMLAENMPIAKIATFTGLSIEEIEAL